MAAPRPAPGRQPALHRVSSRAKHRPSPSPSRSSGSCSGSPWPGCRPGTGRRRRSPHRPRPSPKASRSSNLTSRLGPADGPRAADRERHLRGSSGARRPGRGSARRSGPASSSRPARTAGGPRPPIGTAPAASGGPARPTGTAGPSLRLHEPRLTGEWPWTRLPARTRHGDAQNRQNRHGSSYTGGRLVVADRHRLDFGRPLSVLLPLAAGVSRSGR